MVKMTEERREYARKYYLANKEKLNKYSREYYKDRPLAQEQRREYNKRYFEKKKAAARALEEVTQMFTAEEIAGAVALLAKRKEAARVRYLKVSLAEKTRREENRVHFLEKVEVLR